jgi:hypothetical protein
MSLRPTLRRHMITTTCVGATLTMAVGLALSPQAAQAAPGGGGSSRPSSETSRVASSGRGAGSGRATTTHVTLAPPRQGISPRVSMNTVPGASADMDAAPVVEGALMSRGYTKDRTFGALRDTVNRRLTDAGDNIVSVVRITPFRNPVQPTQEGVSVVSYLVAKQPTGETAFYRDEVNGSMVQVARNMSIGSPNTYFYSRAIPLDQPMPGIGRVILENPASAELIRRMRSSAPAREAAGESLRRLGYTQVTKAETQKFNKLMEQNKTQIMAVRPDEKDPTLAESHPFVLVKNSELRGLRFIDASGQSPDEDHQGPLQLSDLMRLGYAEFYHKPRGKTVSS